ncbi:hypothetical protein BD410DRAFT_838501 [Rickenella mellea]|uniref:Uncharacterized protein n=1 Tax=Rickenella mellea TaxID=50990 RepID=A0A4Y7Q942_9AGAM|nr:hypothetical protein BD410DRAFT_838501 [Rickenella mellea]
MPPPPTPSPTLTYPGGVSSYFSDRSTRNGVWIALIATVILSYSSRSHTGIKLHHIVHAIKTTLDVEDWCAPPGLLRATVLKVLCKWPVFFALPLPEGVSEGQQLWRFDVTRVDIVSDEPELRSDMQMLARVTRKRWHWESLSGNPMSLRRILKQLRGPSTATSLTMNRTAPTQDCVELDRSAVDSSQAKKEYGKHARRCSAPAKAGRYSRRPLLAVDINIPSHPAPSEGPRSAPRSPVPPFNPPLANAVVYRVEQRCDAPEVGGGPLPDAPSGSNALALSEIVSPRLGRATTTLVSSPLLPLDPPPHTTAAENTDTSNGATLFLPSPSPDLVVRKASKRRQEDDEEYCLSDDDSASDWSGSIDSESDCTAQDEPTSKLLLSLTRSGSEFGPPIILGGGRSDQPPRHVGPSADDDEVVRVLQKPTASSSKRKLDDSNVERQVVPRQLKRRVTIAEASATAMGRSGRREIEPQVTKTASPILRDTLEDDNEELVLDGLVNILSCPDDPKRVLEERLVWDTFHRELPQIPRKLYSNALSGSRLFSREYRFSSAPGRSSERVLFYGYVRPST